MIGHYVTVGHSCLITAATIEDFCVVGSKSVLKEGSYMETRSQLGAASVLEKGQRIPTGQLWAGNPAKFIRNLTDEEISSFQDRAEDYTRLAGVYLEKFFLKSTLYQIAEKSQPNVGYQVRK
eukprot:TRINITY_DN1113_c0_g1_i11.p2 TRINITY_DN1113_c0_g1~~TRINITY_DN1113_c0_g1_i11.p2  ORF type:complete len:122 (-),score=16.08 TRINITY_DN1113_c0_g1_i11:47-412(-)